jgi:hypothetical protein
MTTRVCDHCKQEKDIEEFNWKYKALGVRHKTCRECMKWFVRRYFQGNAHDEHLRNVNERKKVAREVARQYVFDYLKTHPCVKCGESDPRVLDFHHRDPVQKETEVSKMVVNGLSLGRLQQEMDKCDVLCANCHRKLTIDERKHWRSRK